MDIQNKGKIRIPARTGFILAMQKKLLQQALAPWPRRSAPLLEVNCGRGDFLPLLWQCGFDVVATEPDAALREAALACPCPVPEIRSAKDDDLPFEDDFFDWVIVHLNGETANPCSTLEEALRVGRRGLMFTFWNRNSLPALLLRCFHKGSLPVAAFSWRQLWSYARGLRAGRLCGFTTLCAPVCTWREHSCLAGANRWLTSLPLGAWAVIRLDLTSPGSVTPLRMRLEKAMASPGPVMEYVNKNMANKIGR